MNALNKERRQLEESSAILLDNAMKGGGDAAEVCASYHIKTKVSLEKQDFHLTSSDEGFRFGLRVLKNNRQGFTSCNTLDTSDLKEIAGKALQISSFSPENPHYTILPGKNISSSAPTPPFDERLHMLSLQTQKDWTKLLRDEALKDPRFRLNEGSVEITSHISLVLNSKGVRQLETDAYCTWGLMGMAVEGENITSFDYFHHLARSAAEVPETLLKTTKKFTQAVLAGLKVGPPKSYKGLVLFTPRAVIDILLDGLVYQLNGRNLVEGTTRWSFLDTGKTLLHTGITLEDAPWKTERSGFSLFDREGTPTANRTLFENGTLKSFLLDHYAAHALGGHSTGNAAGGPASVPTVASHCLILHGGSTPKSALFTLPSKGELLLVHRFSGQVDPVTGDFSGVAKGAEWCRDGEPVYTVKETLISGNVFESLGSSLAGISRETEVIDAGDEAPYMLLDNISVTADS